MVDNTWTVRPLTKVTVTVCTPMESPTSRCLQFSPSSREYGTGLLSFIEWNSTTNGTMSRRVTIGSSLFVWCWWRMTSSTQLSGSTGISRFVRFKWQFVAENTGPLAVMWSSITPGKGPGFLIPSLQGYTVRGPLPEWDGSFEGIPVTDEDTPSTVFHVGTPRSVVPT